MYVTLESHMRDKGETNTPSPILFSRHSAAMLAGGLFEHHENDGLRSSSTQSYLFICFRPDDGRLQTLIKKDYDISIAKTNKRVTSFMTKNSFLFQPNC